VVNSCLSQKSCRDSLIYINTNCREHICFLEDGDRKKVAGQWRKRKWPIVVEQSAVLQEHLIKLCKPFDHMSVSM
jgi:hypothetical protein